MMDDLDLVTMGETGERGVEPVESEAAPRADDVRPDLDLHSEHRHGRKLSLQLYSAVARQT